MTSRKEYTVAVTGSSGYLNEAQNPSMSVRDGLPELIERHGRPPIRILKYPFDFRNVLDDMKRIPTLWDGRMKVYSPKASENDTVYIDGLIHMGMQPGETHWLIEEQARRDGYAWTGDDGKPIPAENGGPGAMFEGLPEVLKPMYDVKAIGEAMKKDNPNIPLRVSNDPGLKYCELQLFTSLATLYRRKEPARVMYFHVIGSTADEDIKRGVAHATSLIKAMVDAAPQE